MTHPDRRQRHRADEALRRDHGGLEAVVFDLDGTLLDSMGLAPRAYQQTIRRLGGPDLSIDRIVREWHIGPTAVVLSHFLARPIDDHDLQAFRDAFAEAVAEVQPFAGVREMLDALRVARLEVAIFTTATRWAAGLMLANSALTDHFDVVVGGDEVADPKPDPAGLLLACSRLGASPDRAAYVGDAAVDVECARRCGAIPILATWSHERTGSSEALAITAAHPRQVCELVTPLTAHLPGERQPVCPARSTPR